MRSEIEPVPPPRRPSPELLQALAWYARDVLQLPRLFRAVTVKRRRNPTCPVKRRKSAFRDPMICIDFLAMAWLGATRLSHIGRYLRARDDLAQLFGLPRFCDHTTAHNFLNAFHRTHLRQLDRVNARLLREHGSAPGARAPIVDLGVAERRVRRAGRRREVAYRWAVAFCAGEAVAQALDPRARPWHETVLEALHDAREHLEGKPHLVRLARACTSLELLRGLTRERLPFLATVTWPWALAQRRDSHGGAGWRWLDDDSRVLDLGTERAVDAPRLALRTVLVERPALAPGLPRQRVALVTSMLDAECGVIDRLAACAATVRQFFDHPRWPLADGKMPSSDPRGNAAYLRLAAIAANVLRLFARHVGAERALPQLRARLRLIPGDATPRRGCARGTRTPAPPAQ